MNKAEEIWKNLRNEIKASEMSQQQIADKLGIKQPTVSEYVNGKSMPALDTFARLCEVLDLDANEVLGINKRPIEPKYINQTFNFKM